MSKQEDQTLKKLVKAYKTLEESSSSYSNVKPNEGIKPIVRPKGEGKHVEDLRGQGARNTDAKQKSGFEGNSTDPEGTNVTSVARESGAKSGAKEVGDSHGKGGIPEGTNTKPVPRGEGSADAPKDYNQDFRQRIQTALGLPLNDKLNQTGKGLGK